ncbi:MAG: hypothetical protein GC159_17655 [Phycisphaera sp.]|nr:hypothetical protein [Phycisphaera sp.]
MEDAMNDSMPELFAPEASNPGNLARMLNMEASAIGLYSPTELGEVLQHQYNASIADDLIRLTPDIRNRVYDLLDFADPPIRTFGDLLDHARPPAELLDLIKRYAKVGHRDPTQPLPLEISRLLYYIAIVLALTRCNTRITTLPPRTLVKGIDMLLDWRWLDPRTLAVLREGRQRAAAEARR